MQETIQTLGIYLPKLIAQLISFGIVLWILQKFAYGRVLEVLEQRRKKIADSIENAERIKVELSETEKKCSEILAAANQQAQTMIDEAKKSAAALAEKKAQDAMAQAEAIITKAHQALALDRQRMMDELKSEVARLVLATTAKVTGKVLTQDDQARLNEETARQLAA